MPAVATFLLESPAPTISAQAAQILEGAGDDLALSESEPGLASLQPQPASCQLMGCRTPVDELAPVGQRDGVRPRLTEQNPGSGEIAALGESPGEIRLVQAPGTGTETGWRRLTRVKD